MPKFFSAFKSESRDKNDAYYLYYISIKDKSNTFVPDFSRAMFPDLSSINNACYPRFTLINEDGKNVYFIFDATKYQFHLNPLEQNSECTLGRISYDKIDGIGEITLVENVKHKKTGEYKSVVHKNDKAVKHIDAYIRKSQAFIDVNTNSYKK